MLQDSQANQTGGAPRGLTPRTQAAVGALLVGLGVALGAFGAHTLTGLVTEARLATFETGVRYQIYGGLGLLLLGLAGFLGRGAPLASLLLLLGALVFPISLYLLVAGAPSFFGLIAPIGGALMIAGWLLAAWRFLKRE